LIQAALHHFPRIRSQLITALLVAGFVLVQAPLWRPAGAQSGLADAAQPSHNPLLEKAALHAREAVLVSKPLLLTVGKSTILESEGSIERVSIANPELAETLAISPHELLVNGRAPGQTTLIVWQKDGARLVFDMTVASNPARIEAVRREIKRELGDQNVDVSYSNDTVFLRGTVKNLTNSDRAVSIAATLGKTINLLNVNVPEGEAQVLIKVKFVDVDRTATSQLGWNLFSTGAGNTLGSLTTSQFSPPVVTGRSTGANFSLSDALNLFVFRPDLNLGATIQALESKNLLQILAEPNVLAIDGKKASFIAGGEFPFPTVQGGAAAGAVTISFRKFGVSIDFVPHITARGTIRLQVTPEVSSLDYANSVVVSGFTIPALSTRRVQTEVELQSGQSFVIAGMLDNREAETLSKIPGLSSIPYLGKLFESRTRTRNHSELLVMVTPELVRPIPAGKTAPQLEMPMQFMTGVRTDAPRTPGVAITGVVPVESLTESLPVEDLIEMNRRQRSETPTPPRIELVLPLQGNPSANPQTASPASAPLVTTNPAQSSQE
jgi:pilus assembly protein CpaC